VPHTAEYNTIVSMLRTHMADAVWTIEAMRQQAELQPVAPVPDDVMVEVVDAFGVAAEWISIRDVHVPRVVMYMHGGGYSTGSVAGFRDFASRLAGAAQARVLLVDYRLAPEHPYPAAVEDAMVVYRWLLDNDVSAGKVVIAGDSAGGGLALATLLALRDAGVELPAAGVGLSPWTDLKLTGASMDSNASADWLVQRKFLELTAEAYLAGADPTTPHSSPLYGDPAGLPPILIQVSNSELLLDDATRFTDRARAAGVDVELDILDDMIHDFQVIAASTQEGSQAIERIGNFVIERTTTAGPSGSLLSDANNEGSG
jgi:epsilon-lactone hydrolase